MTNYIRPTAPIKERNQDIFNRYDFSKRIAESIASRKDESSIVIGINAEWGDGKTSVLNLINQNLRGNPNIVRLKFNPWRFGSEEEILANFFNDLANAIGASVQDNKDLVREMVNKVEPLLKALGKLQATAGAVGNVLMTGTKLLFPKKELEEVRDKVERLLEEEEIRVVVFIDDIDRLEKNEIHAVFRLVRLTADFKFTAYVLAFDKQIVTSALADKFGHTDSLSGESFIDKIIQVPLELPKVVEHDLHQYLLDEIDSLLTFLNINLTAEDADDFYFHITDSLSPFITRPSQVKLYSNTLTFSVPIIRTEVNMRDLMLIEGVRIFVPALYDFIKTNRNQFLFPGAAASFTTKKNMNKANNAWKTEIDRCLQEISPQKTEGLLKLLMTLFPQIETLYSNKSRYDLTSAKSWAKNKRICSAEHFDRYFSYAITKGSVSDLTIDHLINDVRENKFDPGAYAAWFENEITAANISTLFYKLRRRVYKFDDQQLENLPIALAQLSHEVKGKNEDRTLGNAYWGAFHFISDCLEHLNENQRLPTVKKIIEQASNLEFALEWLNSFKGRVRQTYTAELLSEEEMNQANRILAEKIRDTLPKMDRNELAKLTLLYHLVEHWHQYFKNDAENFIINQLNTDKLFLAEFLKSSVTETSNQEYYLSEDNFDAVISLVDPLLIAQHIKEKNDVSLQDKNRKELSATEKLLKDFLIHYNK
ncbi:KAP family P-loop NTPase fold protein [Salisediminibacterium halotolerans]|uniref:KAP family P-loop domain-containing protein n=1 Tax=Salisediminibacterium halotolerans TaxID=517425 RepID=A0A1H9SZD0_9BACI|nr:P-loop NTPase fold protein [Salisediminibacterium haloalkalitolerans]SER90372.1 KAP family P-loop domain-containing protein [Salisediminibacterium haloalkalitolerans]